MKQNICVFTFCLLTMNLSTTVGQTQQYPETISPEDFGAIGNGENDDTAAVRQAIGEAQSSGKLLVSKRPRAVYGVRSTILIPPKVDVAHLGTIKALSNLNPIVSITSGLQRPNGNRIKVSVAGTNTNSTGIYIDTGINLNLEFSAANCTTGVLISSDVEHCDIKAFVENCNVGVLYQATQDGNGGNATPDENNVTIYGALNTTDFMSVGTPGENERPSGNIKVYSEAAKGFSIVIERGDFTLGGYIRGAGQFGDGGGVLLDSMNSKIVFDNITLLSTENAEGNWGLIVEQPAGLQGAMTLGGGSGGAWIKSTSPSTRHSKLRIVQTTPCDSRALLLGDTDTFVEALDVSFGGVTTAGPAIHILNCRDSRIDLANSFQSQSPSAIDCLIGSESFRNTIIVGRRNWQRSFVTLREDTADNVVQYLGSYEIGEAASTGFNGGEPRFKGMQLQHHQALNGTVFWNGEQWIR